MARKPDQRPPVAVGHIMLQVSDIGGANDFFTGIGMRPVHLGDTVSVLELRGGTHLVLHSADGPSRRGPRRPST